MSGQKSVASVQEKKQLAVLAAVVVLALGGLLWFFTRPAITPVIPPAPSVSPVPPAPIAPVTIYDQDLKLSGDQSVPEGETIVLKNGATLAVDGNLEVKGTLKCEGGPLSIRVTGGLVVAGELRCDLAAALPEGDVGNGVMLVVGGSAVFEKTAVVASNGSVQVVDDAAKLAESAEAVKRLYDGAAEDVGEGVRVGPFIPIESAEAVPGALLEPAVRAVRGTARGGGKFLDLLVPAAQAAAFAPAVDIGGRLVAGTVQIGGTWVMGNGGAPPEQIIVPTPPKGVERIILNFNFSSGKTVVLDELTLVGPSGRDGANSDDSCAARGKNGDNAFRLSASVADIEIKDFTVYLGDGGKGGDAATRKDCDPGEATGGDGGEAGNMKIVSTGSFKITGKMSVRPGHGGKGGEAHAYGKDGDNGCPGSAGSKATARGGKGGDNKKGLKVVNVEGVGNITLGELVGGDGGPASAVGGKGGDGVGAKCPGGKGGDAFAYGGGGGNTVSRTAKSYGGNGGDADPYPGTGGKGGDGNRVLAGGKGGGGGNGGGKPGIGGTGKTEKGADGKWSNETGGFGGNGGDGCKPGAGGQGGTHIRKGDNGAGGKDLCTAPAAPAPQTPPAQPDQPPAVQTKTISVIAYGGSYIPVEQLTQYTAQQCPCCDAPHWHANTGTATTIAGQKVTDPYAHCGLGKVSEHPVIAIQVPK